MMSRYTLPMCKMGDVGLAENPQVDQDKIKRLLPTLYMLEPRVLIYYP